MEITLKQKKNGSWVDKGTNFPYKIGGFAPSGTIEIDANGLVDVKDYEFAKVSVQPDIESGVVFIDYDGSIIEIWENDMVANKTALPTNPTHSRLVSEGWNWTLAEIKQFVEDVPHAFIIVGQLYHTASGKTEIDIVLTPSSGKTVNCKIVGSKDWGDGTTNSNTSHTYSKYGVYTIKTEGTSIPSGSSSSSGLCGASSSNEHRLYPIAIYLSDKIKSIGNRGVGHAETLRYVTFSQSLETIDLYAFRDAFSVECVILPKNTTVGSDAFNNCRYLYTVSCPKNFTAPTGMVNTCVSLKNINIVSSEIPEYYLLGTALVKSAVFPNVATI